MIEPTMIEPNENAVLEQLSAVVMHYPVAPGDTLSHALAAECARRGWICRDRAGSWIPRAAGIEIHRKAQAAGR